MVANFMDKGGKGTSESDMQAAKITEKEGLLTGGDDAEDEDEGRRCSHRNTPAPSKTPSVTWSFHYHCLEVEAARTPDESSDGDFEVLVEVDRVTPVSP